MEEDDRRHLTFVKVAERVYRVFNKRTGRFHNPEPGIDWVT